MLCKEDVLLWFKDLESYKRIDLIYELLNMCLPFELRFIGSCIEEIGRYSYQELRGSSINANDFDKLTKDLVFFNKGLLDDNVRHRLLINLSLLSSRNYCVANWLYKHVLRTDWFEDYLGNYELKDDDDDDLLNEFLLLFIMALHHPAFTFDQKLYLKKILNQLIKIRDNNNKNPSSPKLSNHYGYPPGFGYPTTIQTMNVLDGTMLPTVKSTVMPYGDENYQQTTIPTAPPQPPSHIQPEYIWNRPGYPYGAPEIPAFPVTSISPLVSQSTSPIHSRNTSPHRSIITTRSTAAPPPPPPQLTPQQQQQQPPPPPLEIIQITPQLTGAIDPLSPNIYNTEIKLGGDEELINDDKAQLAWIPTTGLYNRTKELKQHNGLRYSNNKISQQRPFHEQFHRLSIDGGDTNTLLLQQHQSNSSSNSSLNQTPPDTPSNLVPTTTPVTGTGTVVTTQQQQHCRSVGNTDKPLVVNGIPPPTFQPLCDTTSPPPPPPNYNNCTVPYTNYPTAAPPPPFTTLPARSMFPYTTNQSYRPPFTTHFTSYQQQQQQSTQQSSQQQNSDNAPSYPPTTFTFPYLSIMYSNPQYSLQPAPSQQQPQQQPRNPNCYNCGSVNHIGQDCTRQNIEDITQKKTYNLDFTTNTLATDSSDK